MIKKKRKRQKVNVKLYAKATQYFYGRLKYKGNFYLLNKLIAEVSRDKDIVTFEDKLKTIKKEGTSYLIDKGLDLV